MDIVYLLWVMRNFFCLCTTLSRSTSIEMAPFKTRLVIDFCETTIIIMIFQWLSTLKQKWIVKHPSLHTMSLFWSPAEPQSPAEDLKALETRSKQNFTLLGSSELFSLLLFKGWCVKTHLSPCDGWRALTLCPAMPFSVSYTLFWGLFFQSQSKIFYVC